MRRRFQPNNEPVVINSLKILESLDDESLDLTAETQIPLLDLISSVDLAIEKDGATDAVLLDAKPFLNALARRQGLSVTEMFLICVVTNFTVEGGGEISEIVDFCQCSNMSLLSLLPTLDRLVADGYLTKEIRFKDENYSLSDDLLKSYRRNEPFTIHSYEGLDDVRLLSEYYDLTNKLKHNQIDATAFDVRCNRLLADNTSLTIVRTLKGFELDPVDEKIVLHLCRCYALHGHHTVDIERGVMFLLPEGCDHSNTMYELLQGESALFRKGIIEHGCDEGMRDNNEIALTKKARRQILADVKMLRSERAAASSSLILSKDITRKQLFFEPTVERQVSQLTSLLSDANLRSVQQRLKSTGMRTGFTCIFYGQPGTGKTETVLQLARQTGRSVMQVNISEIRSKWVGESEKNIQALFDSYRRQVKAHRRCPILLFNEADALINTRSTHTDHAVDKMENTLQNIILQEMEKLDGILIATTNLEGNLDKAFERRFLYKVEFKRPNLEARTNIWLSLMPNVDESVASQLAEEFDFSGGQIENIARKSTIDNILYNTPINDVVRLRQYCEQEQLDKRTTRRLGF